MSADRVRRGVMESRPSHRYEQTTHMQGGTNMDPPASSSVILVTPLWDGRTEYPTKSALIIFRSDWRPPIPSTPPPPSPVSPCSGMCLFD